MKIKEAIKLLQIDYELFPDDGEHYLKGVNALKKQLEVSLVEVYPYNLALSIVGRMWDESEERALEFSVKGIDIGLETLTDRERKVLEQRFKDKLTLEQVAKNFEITRERIRQIEAKALRKLRHPSRMAKMKAYTYYDVVKHNEDYNAIKEENKNLEKAISLYTKKQINAEELEVMANIADVRNIRLEELELSVRTYNCLKRIGIFDLGEITDMTLEELSKVRNLGKKSLEEVLRKLKEYGIELNGIKEA